MSMPPKYYTASLHAMPQPAPTPPSDRRPDGMDLRMTFAPEKGYPNRE
jgi:hypothetical protein